MNDAQGNDDSAVIDEDSDPYRPKQNHILSHAVGQLSSTDNPDFRAGNSWGGPARSFALEAVFREFARVELWDETRTTGRFWFRVSEFSGEGLWHHYFRTSWDWAQNKWTDNGSSSGPGHP